MTKEICSGFVLAYIPLLLSDGVLVWWVLECLMKMHGLIVMKYTLLRVMSRTVTYTLNVIVSDESSFEDEYAFEASVNEHVSWLIWWKEAL